MKNQDQPLATLTDMVFEHRNRAYGAFELRKSYSRNVNKAVVIGVSLFLMAIISPLLFAEKSKIILDGPIVVLNPENFNQNPEPPKPIESQKPIEQAKTERFVVIVPKPNEDVIEELLTPSQSDLENAAISNAKHDGVETPEIVSEPPAESSKESVIIEMPIEDKTEFTSVEIQPTFAGGIAEMYKFLSKNLKYPSAAQRAGVQGKVFLSFVVEKDGSLSNVQDIKGIGFGCDEEAMQVIKLMPKWNPGRQQGNAVRVRFTLPIFFKLEE